MTDLVLGIRLTADGKGLVGEVKLSREELEKLRKTTQDAGRDTKSGAEANRGYAQSLQSLARFAGLSAAAIAAMAIGAVKRSVEEAARAEQAHLKLEAVLRATGHAAGFSKPQLDAFAESMKRATGIDDDQLRNSMAVMLTFKQVQGDTFKQAMTMAADLSKLLGQDLQSSVMMLGKALEDPEGGLLALRRAGVSFNDQQKDMIKGMVEFGEQSRALTTILQIMREQGIDKIAESMNTGYVGSMNRASLAYQDLLKAIGNTSLVRAPTLAFFDALAGRLNSIAETISRGNLGDALLRLNPLTAPLFGALPVPAEAARPGWRPIRAATETPESQGWRDLMTKQEAEINKILDARAKQQDELVAGLRDEAATLGMTTEQAKLYKAEQLGITGAQMEQVKIAAERIAQYKAEKDALDAYLAGEAMHQQVLDEIAELELKKSQANAAAVLEMDKRIESLTFENTLMGLTNAERARAIALHELEARAVNLSTDELERYRKKLEEVYGERRAKEAQLKAIEEQKRMNDEIGRSLTDALLRAFEAGKSFGQAFRDSLVNMFKTMVLRPVIQFILSPVSGAIGAALGGLGIPGLGNAAGLGGAAMSGLFQGGAYSLSSAGGGGGISGAIGGLSAGADAIFQGLGVSTGSQFIADIGNYGFGVPVMGGLVNLAMGNTKGAIYSTALGIAGTMIGGPIGGMIGSAVGSVLGGKKKKKPPPQFTGYDIEGTIGPDASDLALYSTFDWRRQALVDPGRPFANSLADVYRGIESSGSRLGLGSDPLGTVTISAHAQDLGEMLGRISDELALRLLPNLKDFSRMGESATQTLERVAQAADQMRGVVRSLPGQLGITALEQYRDSLKVSEFLSPIERFGAAQTMLGETYARARGGDLTAVQSFPQLLQSALTIGRDVYASGPQFAELFVEGNRKLNDLLAHQQALQTDILKDVPITIIEKANDQIAAIRAQTATLAEELRALRGEVRQLAAA